MKRFYVYILSNTRNTTFYTGVTSNLERRIAEHKSASVPGFTKKYNVAKLVYFEEYSSGTDAIAREKQLKNWHREWKLNLIKGVNPTLTELTSL